MHTHVNSGLQEAIPWERSFTLDRGRPGPETP